MKIDSEDKSRRVPVAMRFPEAMLALISTSASRRGESRHEAVLRLVNSALISERKAAADRAQEMFDD